MSNISSLYNIEIPDKYLDIARREGKRKVFWHLHGVQVAVLQHDHINQHGEFYLSRNPQLSEDMVKNYFAF